MTDAVDRERFEDSKKWSGDDGRMTVFVFREEGKPDRYLRGAKRTISGHEAWKATVSAEEYKAGIREWVLARTTVSLDDADIFLYDYQVDPILELFPEFEPMNVYLTITKA